MECLDKATLARYIRPCLKDLPTDHPIHALMGNIRSEVFELVMSPPPMSLEEIRLYEARTKGLTGYDRYREVFVSSGERPKYDCLQ